MVVNPENAFASCLTVEELRKIWEPSSTLQSWSQVRQGFPDQPLRLYGPGTNSGTFDYFTEVIGGEVGSSRADYTASEDDNVLVQGVSRDVNAIGYFGLAYYVENKGKLKAIPVDDGDDSLVTDLGDFLVDSSLAATIDGFSGGDWSSVQFATTGGVFLEGSLAVGAFEPSGSGDTLLPFLRSHEHRLDVAKDRRFRTALREGRRRFAARHRIDQLGGRGSGSRSGSGSFC